EARAASALSHPHIVTLFDVGRVGDTPYVVFELVDGQTLRAAQGGRPLPLKRALEIGRQLADALAAAHRKGIVHRDLKPDNVIVAGAGAKILDFGLAKLLEPEARPGVEHTGTGVALGTAPYMSPEQVRGAAVDARSDIFSLGAVLHEMLTGQRA